MYNTDTLVRVQTIYEDDKSRACAVELGNPNGYFQENVMNRGRVLVFDLPDAGVRLDDLHGEAG